VTIEAALGVVPTAIAYPFGAVDPRVRHAARAAGYSTGFGVGGRWDDNPMSIPRAPVHAWSPRMPVVGPLGSLERLASVVATRCSIGTTLLRRLTLAR
jgi:hypothetical protein